MNDLKKIIEQVRNERIFINFFSLGVLQFTNFLIPLVTIPYLLRTIGVANFGQVSIALAVMSYFVIITEYGFNLTSTRAISLEKDNTKHISSVFSQTLTTQLALVLVSLILLLILVYTIPYFHNKRILFLYSFSIVLGQVLLMPWFFQGIEKMKFMTYLNLVSKITLLVLIFTVIRKPDHYVYVPLIYASGNILSGLVGLSLVFNVFHVKYELPRILHIREKLKNGFPVFISSFSTSAYLNSNIIILGFFTSETNVGFYSAAEKVMQIVRGLLVIFSQAIYPRVCYLSQQAHSEVVSFLKTFFIPFSIVVLAICILIFMFSDIVTNLIIGFNSSMASNLIKVLIIAPFIVCLNIPFYQTLLAYDFRNQYMKVNLFGALLNLILNFILASQWEAMGTAYSIILTELFILIGLGFSLEKLGAKHSLLNFRFNK